MIELLSKEEANKKLCAELPFLIQRNRNDNKELDYEYTELDDECPQGWTKLKLDFYREIKPLLIKADFLDKFRIFQSKEKYGYWHLYTNGIPKEISKEYYEIFKKYENLSEKTCIFCGEEAKMVNFGWISPICKKCWDKGYIWDSRPYEKVIMEDDD